MQIFNKIKCNSKSSFYLIIIFNSNKNIALHKLSLQQPSYLPRTLCIEYSQNPLTGTPVINLNRDRIRADINLRKIGTFRSDFQLFMLDIKIEDCGWSSIDFMLLIVLKWIISELHQINS